MKLDQMYKPTIHTVLEAEFDQLIAELCEEYSQLKESDMLEEGMKDFIKKGAEKVKALASKAHATGQKAYDAIMSKVLITMNKDIPEVAQKLKGFAGKHKMATAIIAVVGASLLAMEPAAASAAMDSLAQQDVSSVADMIQADIDPSAVYNGGEDQVVGGDTFSALSGDEQGNVANKMIDHIKGAMEAENRQYTVNGKQLPFEEVVKLAEKGTGVSAEDFMKFMANKDMNQTEIHKEFTKWLGQGVKKSMGI